MTLFCCSSYFSLVGIYKYSYLFSYGAREHTNRHGESELWEMQYDMWSLPWYCVYVYISMAIGIVRVHYDDMTSLPDRESWGNPCKWQSSPLRRGHRRRRWVLVYCPIHTLYIRKIGFASTLLLLLADACQLVCRSLFGQYCMPPKVSAATHLDISFSS